MTSNPFKISSIKTRVTALTLAIFIIGAWTLSYYVTQQLQRNITKQISEQQLSTNHGALLFLDLDNLNR
jgi:cell division protein FtsL